MKRILFILVSLIAVAATSLSAQSNYRLKAGDTIAIEVLEDNTLNRTTLVLPDGTITFPFAGTISAGGQTVAQLQQALTQRISSNFASEPTVFVTVASVAPTVPSLGQGQQPEVEETIAIYLLGEFSSPGPKAVLPGTTLLQAMAQGGGFTPFAATKRLQLRRTDPNTRQPIVYTINYRAIERGGRLTQDVYLREGDVILAPERRLFE